MLAAFRQFRTYPLQSVLIILAVALGVAVVTAVAATFAQFSNQMDSSQLWQRQILLQPKASDWSGFYNGANSLPVREVGLVDEEKVSLTLDDLARVKEAAPTVDYAYVTNWTSFTARSKDGETFEVDLRAITADYLAAAGVEVVQGSLFSEGDFAEARKVILLSEVTLERFGLTEDAVGETVHLADFGGESLYTVVGVLEGAAQTTDGPNAFIPYIPAPWESDGLRELSFAVEGEADVAPARAELQAYAERTWGGRVTVTSAEDWGMEGQFRLMAVVIAAFASTALAAAALNIMNLMLARVLRRRHSIGVQRSLGATRADILWGFLNESLLLGVIGGLLGVGAGYGLFVLFNSYQMAVYGDDVALFLASFPWMALLVGFALALLTSLLFGFYPAWQASRLRPVEALREVQA